MAKCYVCKKKTEIICDHMGARKPICAEHRYAFHLAMALRGQLVGRDVLKRDCRTIRRDDKRKERRT